MTSRSDQPKDKLLELAMQTLGVTLTSTPIPTGYIAELQKHVTFSKDDTNFRIYPQPGYGYGNVKCLEQGCEGITISLGMRTGVANGGQHEGIGSLSAYRVHVEEHPTHKANRFARVKAECNSQTSTCINSAMPFSLSSSSGLTHTNITSHHGTSHLLTAIDSFDKSTLSSNTSKTNTQHIASMKAEPSDSPRSSPSSSSIPRKRHFVGEGTDTTTPSSDSHDSSVVSKRPRLGTIKSTVDCAPLGNVDFNSPNAAATHVNMSASLDSDAARSLLLETNRALDTAETLLAHYTRKSRMSAYDKQRMFDLREQQLKHMTTKARCELALQSASNIQGASGVAIPERSSIDVKSYTAPPTTFDSQVQLLPVASGSSIQPEISSSVKDISDSLPHFHSPLPNYGDTLNYESDDDIYGHQTHFTHRGHIANPGDIDRFLIEAGNSESFDGNESVDQALAKLGLNKLGEQLPFMSIGLMPHQVIGVAWMLEHERGNHKGGILADEMGLGKTVQMIATIVQHRSDDPAVKTTLICAPVSLLYQWKLEIETKTDGALSCLIYHGSNKPKSKKDLQKHDIVLTTFQTLALEWPNDEKKKKKRRKKGQNSDDFIESDSGKEKKVKKKGLLLRMMWFRVVLDEAQNIRNRHTRISNAVTVLDAKHRWCLTGTPVTNSLADCYGLLRFLQIRPWYDWQDFNSHIVKLERKRPDLASSRLQAILNACLIRRKKDSVLDGKNLIELPPKEVVLRKLTFSQDERDIYNAIEKQSQAIFNKYLRAGTVLKNYSHVLVLLLRLRQLCSHPCLIQEQGDAFLVPGEDNRVKHEVQTELERATILAGDQFVSTMKAKFKAVMLERIAAEKQTADAAIDDDECPICFDTFTNPVVTRCCHSFCADCIDAVLKQPPVEDGNQPRYSMSERPCPTCRDPIQKEMVFQRSAFEPTDAELTEPEPNSPTIVEDEDDDGPPIAANLLQTVKKQKKSYAKCNGNGKRNKRVTKQIQDSDSDPDDDNEDYSDLSDFILESDEDEEEKDARRELKKKLGRNKRIVSGSDEGVDTNDDRDLLPPIVAAKRKGKQMQRFLPSTKMKEMMVLLKEWAESEETRNEKTMILSQWTSCLDLIADYLDENGFTFVRYQGSMTRLSRDESVKVFMSQGKARIMLMSLKCGGVGLNLTRANRVISLDLGWSAAVENQAFDRVHRLGQVRPVTVQRLVVEDTVEARILALQERKQNLADGSLGEGSGKKLGRLSVKDLANLFGLNAWGHQL